MRSVASVEPIFEQKTRKAKSGAESFFQGMHNLAYTHKTLRKLSKSLSTRSTKADSRVSRAERPAASGIKDQAGSWDDGRVGAWAANSRINQVMLNGAVWQMMGQCNGIHAVTFPL